MIAERKGTLGKVLIVDDDQALCSFVELGLGPRGFACTSRHSAEDGIAALQAQDFDLLVSDIHMSGMTGIELCRKVAQERPHLPIVVVTAFGDVETAVSAIRAGAYDFVTKPIDLEALTLTIERALQHRRLNDEVKRLRSEVLRPPAMDELVGTSAPLRRVCDLLDRIRDSDASVLISGESGTGKEVVARVLHKTGRREAGPFVAVNCAAIPEALLESELFGHAKGAFTDARTRRQGLLIQATGGTLFLDEIGDMPIGLQPKLLRALQERTVRPVGGDVEVPFDARIVCATHRDMQSAVEDRTFREDLYFRINVVHIELPPLRTRGGDVFLLADLFLERMSAQAGKRVKGLTSAAARKLSEYPWPGNVRELMNCIERAVALTRNHELDLEDLPERIRDYASSQVFVTSDDPSDLLPLAEVERRYIQRVFESVGGNKSLAAKVLGVDRKTLYRKLDRFRLGGRREDCKSDGRAEGGGELAVESAVNSADGK